MPFVNKSLYDLCMAAAGMPVHSSASNTAASPCAVAPSVPRLRSAASASAVASNNKIIKVKAPPGKLGIVIDTTIDGPVVHKVVAGSPMEGELFPGDIIMSIDDVETKAMSASAITSLMVKTANQRRTLSIMKGGKVA